MLLRSEVNQKETWDLTAIFKTEEAFEAQLEEVKQLANKFESNYKGKLNNKEIITQAILEYETLLEKLGLCGAYTMLNNSADLTDSTNSERVVKYSNISSKVRAQLSFFESELLQIDQDILASIDHGYIKTLLRDKPYQLSPEVEKTLAQLSGVLSNNMPLYNKIKLSDADFGTFEVGKEEYPLSFVLFENKYDYVMDHEIRRAAHKKFSETLSNYAETMASNYLNHVQKEKVMADMRGYDSVIDYLLHDQEVSKEMYHRQIDLIMEKFARVMRKYATLLKDIYGLDKMTFMDLKLVVDPDFEPEITIEESRKYLLDGLHVLGEDYLNMINRAYDEKWVDFVQNKGKSSGAFCSSPYGTHPFILISWTSKMREVFVMAHELGHAGHFYNSHKHQSLLNARPSLYFIEAPSTTNEMIMANKMLRESDNPRLSRWIYATMIARTYYHNFVTHLLEAHFQRKVYALIDEGKGFNAAKLNEMMIDTYKEFWGDAVEIGDECKVTWMRQQHYYKGLYSYTYSAGLTISTLVSQMIDENPEKAQDWLKVLQAGGTKDPIALAKMMDIDLTTEKPLLDTIDRIEFIVDEIIRLTEELK